MNCRYVAANQPRSVREYVDRVAALVYPPQPELPVAFRKPAQACENGAEGAQRVEVDPSYTDGISGRQNGLQRIEDMA